jgi:hypothetical protein
VTEGKPVVIVVPVPPQYRSNRRGKAWRFSAWALIGLGVPAAATIALSVAMHSLGPDGPAPANPMDSTQAPPAVAATGARRQAIIESHNVAMAAPDAPPADAPVSPPVPAPIVTPAEPDPVSRAVPAASAEPAAVAHLDSTGPALPYPATPADSQPTEPPPEAAGGSARPATLAEAFLIDARFAQGVFPLRPPTIPIHIFPAVPFLIVQPPAPVASVDANRVAELEREREALARELDRVRLERAEKVVPAQPAAAATRPAEPAAVPAGPSERGLTSLPASAPARVLVRYARGSVSARRRAETVVAMLAAKGIEVVDLRDSAAVVRPVLTYSYAPDEKLARDAGALAGVDVVRRPPPKIGLLPRPGTMELGLTGP